MVARGPHPALVGDVTKTLVVRTLVDGIGFVCQ